jgi:hypothetical protein
MRVASTIRLVGDRNLSWSTVSVRPAREYCTAVAPADVSDFDARLVLALTQRVLAWVPPNSAVLL